jgi:transcription elongation factor GreA
VLSGGWVLLGWLTFSAAESIMNKEKLPMTADGFNSLEAELKKLKNVDRKEVIRAISAAREHGDLSENAEYHAAKDQQGFIEARVMELEDKISRAEVIDVSKLSGKTIKFGATVTLIDCDDDTETHYQIVGVDEADVKAGRISVTAPLARALIGKATGDEVEVITPGGQKTYEVKRVRYK